MQLLTNPDMDKNKGILDAAANEVWRFKNGKTWE